MPIGAYSLGGAMLAGQSTYGYVYYGSPPTVTSTPEAASDLISWEVVSSVENGSSARITLANSGNKYDSDDFIGKQISLHSIINGVNRQWFRGEITSMEPENSLGGVEKTMVFQCNSHFYDLNKKPVNTVKYTSATGQAILEELLGTYGGVDSAFYDFSSCAGTSFSDIVIQEDSLLHAAQQIAEACDQEIYINRYGQMVTAPQSSGGNISLDSSRIMSWSRRRSVEDGFSIVRVRGRYLSLTEAGSQDFVNADFSAFTPVITTELFIEINGFATDVELMSATYSSTTPNTSVFLNQVLGNGFVRLRIVKTGGAQFSVGQNSFNVTISGLRLWSAEFTSLSNQTATSPKALPLANLSSFRENYRTERRFIRWDGRSPKPKDEREESRVEVVGKDSALIAEFGVRWYEIDNPYIPTLAAATNVALRAFSDFQQSRKTYTIECIDDTMDINYTLTVDGDDPAPLVLTIREIRVSYDASTPSLTVQIAAEELPVS